jgi:hypothetical protein
MNGVPISGNESGELRLLTKPLSLQLSGSSPCLLDPCQPCSHVGLVLFVEVAEEEGPGEPLTLKPGQALGLVELLIAEARRLRRPVAGKPRVNR